MKVVVRAGGVGSRLWPYSRGSTPKQLFPLVSDKPMLLETLERALMLAKPDDIYVSMGREYEAAVRPLCKKIPPQNIVIEPERRDTAAAVGLESLHIAAHDSSAVVVGLASDHVVTKTREFVRVVQAAVETVEQHPESIVAIGIVPRSAHTGYGYIEQGERVAEMKGTAVHRVSRFIEKPNAAAAQQFLESKRYLWNANMFVWNVGTILKLFRQFQPMLYEHLEKIESAMGTPHYEATLMREYGKMETVAIEHAIIEKAQQLLTIPADIGWSDIGDWAGVAAAQPLNRDGNVVKANHIGMGTTRSLVYGQKDKLIATIGCDNMVIVDTPDVLLVMPKERSQDVKKLVELVRKEEGERYL